MKETNTPDNNNISIHTLAILRLDIRDHAKALVSTLKEGKELSCASKVSKFWDSPRTDQLHFLQKLSLAYIH